MKKCLLLTLTILGFTSFSYAAPKITTLVCDDGENPWVSASLVLGTDWGPVAYLGDNYDSARNEKPSQENGYGMTCKKVGQTLECLSHWGIAKTPAKVVFTKDTAGNISATFNRSAMWDNETVTFPCAVSVR